MPPNNPAPRNPSGRATPGAASTPHGFFVAAVAPVALTRESPAGRLRFEPADGSFTRGDLAATWSGDRLRNPSGRTCLVRCDVVARFERRRGSGRNVRWEDQGEIAVLWASLDIGPDDGPAFLIGQVPFVAQGGALCSIDFPPVFAGGTFRADGAALRFTVAGLPSSRRVVIEPRNVVTFDLGEPEPSA